MPSLRLSRFERLLSEVSSPLPSSTASKDRSGGTSLDLPRLLLKLNLILKELLEIVLADASLTDWKLGRAVPLELAELGREAAEELGREAGARSAVFLDRF